MSKFLILPVTRHVNAAAVAQSVAQALPQAAVFNPVQDAHAVEQLLAAGKGDDWLDDLIGKTAIECAKPGHPRHHARC